MPHNEVIDKTIHVVMATDDNYAHHLAVCVASLLKNLSENRLLTLHVIHDGLSGLNQEKIGQLRAIRDFRLDLIRHDLSRYDGIHSKWTPHLSKLAFSRLELGRFLPQVGRCLYLDCDLVVRDDIAELYDTDDPQHYFGAVEEIEDVRVASNKHLGIPPTWAYFNSGVLVLNLDVMREDGCFERAVAFLEGNEDRLLCADQDILNALFYDDWFVLPLKWNVSQNTVDYGARGNYLHYNDEEVKAAVCDPAIVHFIAKNKPDTGLCKHPFAQEYWDYLALTPWKDKIVPKKNPD